MQPTTLAAGLVDIAQALLSSRLWDPLLEKDEPIKGVPVEIDSGAIVERDAHLLQEVILDPIVRHHLGWHQEHCFDLHADAALWCPCQVSSWLSDNVRASLDHAPAPPQ